MAGGHLVRGTSRRGPTRSSLRCVKCGGPSRGQVALARLTGAVRRLGESAGLTNAEIGLGLHQSGLTRVSLQVTESFSASRAGRRLAANSLAHSSGRMDLVSLVDPSMPWPALIWVIRLMADAALDPAPVEYGDIAFQFAAGKLVHVLPRPSFTPDDLAAAMAAPDSGGCGGGT